MANKILENDEAEYDAKQEPVKVPSKQEGLKAQAAKWRAEIEAIDDEKLLSYIQDCCSAKRQMMSADERLTKKGDKEPCLVGSY